MGDHKDGDALGMDVQAEVGIAVDRDDASGRMTAKATSISLASGVAFPEWEPPLLIPNRTIGRALGAVR